MGLPIGSGEVESAITLHSPKAPENLRGDLAFTSTGVLYGQLAMYLRPAGRYLALLAI